MSMYSLYFYALKPMYNALTFCRGNLKPALLVADDGQAFVFMVSEISIYCSQ